MDKKLTFENLRLRATGGYYYLASPYSHHDPEIVKHRVKEAYQHHALLLSNRVFSFCPVWSCHEAAHFYDMPKDAEYWKAYNVAFIMHCTGIIICDMHGWQDSKGVQWEIGIAKKEYLPVYLMSFFMGSAYFEQLHDPFPQALSGVDRTGSK
jgi:hypothetical protein